MEIFTYIMENGPSPITSVEIYYNGIGTGVQLTKISEYPTIYVMPRTEIPGGLSTYKYLLEYVATNEENKDSLMFPFLNVEN